MESSGMMTGGFQSGIINQFRTGNLVFDMIVACLIPLIIAKVMSTYENFPIDVTKLVVEMKMEWMKEIKF
eukprot:Awhi_evm2s10032